MTDIFDTQTTNVETTTTNTSQLADQLVGEGKRFKNIDELAKSKLEADTFIEKLKQEQAELRERLDKSLNADEQLAALKAELQELKSSGKPKENTTPELTSDKIRELVQASITEHEIARTATQNTDTVNSAMVSQFGSVEKAKEVFLAKAKELNMAPTELKDIASKSPTAFYTLLGLNNKGKDAVGNVSTKSTVNTEAFNSSGNLELKFGTKEYFDNIRKTDERRYYSADIQKQIMKSMREGVYVT